MLNQDQVQALWSPFPPEALSKDTSRGFELTSIKAAYVIERLNEVFGLCGVGWRYVHTPFEELQSAQSARSENRDIQNTLQESISRLLPCFYTDSLKVPLFLWTILYIGFFWLRAPEVITGRFPLAFDKYDTEALGPLRDLGYNKGN